MYRNNFLQDGITTLRLDHPGEGWLHIDGGRKVASIVPTERWDWEMEATEVASKNEVAGLRRRPVSYKVTYYHLGHPVRRVNVDWLSGWRRWAADPDLPLWEREKIHEEWPYGPLIDAAAVDPREEVDEEVLAAQEGAWGFALVVAARGADVTELVRDIERMTKALDFEALRRLTESGVVRAVFYYQD